MKSIIDNISYFVGTFLLQLLATIGIQQVAYMIGVGNNELSIFLIASSCVVTIAVYLKMTKGKWYGSIWNPMALILIHTAAFYLNEYLVLQAIQEVEIGHPANVLVMLAMYQMLGTTFHILMFVPKQIS